MNAATTFPFLDDKGHELVADWIIGNEVYDMVIKPFRGIYVQLVRHRVSQAIVTT
jgi:hypothetical protein